MIKSLLIAAMLVLVPTLNADKERATPAPTPTLRENINTQSNGAERATLWDIKNPDELVELNFKDIELSNLIKWVENLLSVSFILDDNVSPLPAGGKSTLGTKITFKTQSPITKKQVGELFDTFLELAGLARAKGPISGSYRITTTDPNSVLSVNKAQLPTYIGVNSDSLPEGEGRIRYVYFLVNAGLSVVTALLDKMKSATAPAIITFPELRAVLITDKSSNIRAMMRIIQEIDRMSMPETISIIKLKNTDATQIATLYTTLAKEEQGLRMQQRLADTQKGNGSAFSFPASVRLIAEPRSNRLFVIGSREAVKKVEDFILNQLDQKSGLEYAPVHVHRLRYVDATATAKVLQDVTNFAPQSAAAQYGGVRDGDKYFKKLSITAEKNNNSLIINASYEDYQKLAELLAKIDVEQPQVALKVLILNIDLSDQASLGTQIRSKTAPTAAGISNYEGIFGKNVTFQTSGIFAQPNIPGRPVVENPAGSGALRLLGNLLNLATSGTAGSTLLSLGSDAMGVFGLLELLESNSRVSVIANPFVIATHKYPAIVSIGETRRVQTATIKNVTSTDTFADYNANLTVNITPQISVSGLISLDVSVALQQFTDTQNTSNGNTTNKTVRTSVIVADNEVLALGGMIKDSIEEVQSKVPIFGDIPPIGWLFKNKFKQTIRNSLVILIAPEIIYSHTSDVTNQLTHMKIEDAKATIAGMGRASEHRDPIHRWFFQDTNDNANHIIDEFTKAPKPTSTAVGQRNTTILRRKKLASIVKGTE